MFRIDEYQYRFVLEQGAKDDLDLIGWQVDDERALSAVADQLTAAGVEVQRVQRRRRRRAGWWS